MYISKPVFSAVVCFAIFLAGFCLSAAEKAVASLPGYEVRVKVSCSSPEAAQSAELKFLPLPPGKRIAFSCRWDDNNFSHPRMKKLMQKYGYKGTFYLLAPKDKFRNEVLPELCKDGFTVGNHTLHHYSLSQLTPNGVFYEMLGARIMLETFSGQTVTAFIFPGGSFENKFYPDIQYIISSCLRRTGMLGGPDKATTRLNKLPGNEFFNTDGCNIYPGDRNTSAAKFDEHVAHSMPAAGKTAHMTLGIHVWHSDKDFAELEKAMKKYSGLPDWWYCNENEFLAYTYMYHHARVTGKKVDGDNVEFTVQLPYPEYLGSDVPLWAKCDGKDIKISHSRKVPAKIYSLAPDGSSVDFPGLNAKIYFSAPDRIRFELINSGSPLEDLRLILRLPPDFKEETICFNAGNISGNYQKEWQLTPSDRQSSGTQLTALQMDFIRHNEASRIWVTQTRQIKSRGKSAYKVFCSPVKFSEVELKKWCLPETEIDRTKFFKASHRLDYLETIMKVPERAVNKEMLTVIMDFEGGRKMKLQGDLPGTVYLNGKKLATADGTLHFDAPSGKCRILLQYLKTRKPVRYMQFILTP